MARGRLPSGEPPLRPRSASGLVRLTLHLSGLPSQLKVDPSALPSASHLRPADIGPMTALIPALAHPAILHAVIVASVFPPAAAGPSSAVTPTAEAGDVKYSATARRRIFALARLLEIDTRLIVRAEERVATELYDVLRQGAATEEAAKAKEEVERVRKQREEGWGGSMGRWVATGAGIVVRACPCYWYYSCRLCAQLTRADCCPTPRSAASLSALRAAWQHPRSLPCCPPHLVCLRQPLRRPC